MEFQLLFPIKQSFRTFEREINATEGAPDTLGNESELVLLLLLNIIIIILIKSYIKKKNNNK